ncbi:MAG: hypothetical protein HWD61_06955 [Parachlamydiaceae bacterium]|nr:MAG: hypothetical protein HWD61_06955 [Parachlamydiaceae bacterium]
MFNRLSPDSIKPYVQFLSSELLATLGSRSLGILLDAFLQDAKDDKRDQAIQMLTAALESRFFEDNVLDYHIYTFLEDYLAPRLEILPFLSPSLQAKVISTTLRTGINNPSIYQDENGNILKEATHLPAERWFETSKKMENLLYESALKELPIDQFAAFVNGQAGNHALLRGFFEDVFGGDNEELKEDLLERLNPEVFEFEGASYMHTDIWEKFFELLSEHWFQHSRAVLISASKSLYREFARFGDESLKYFELLTVEQRRSLPLDEYPPEVCLAFAALVDSLDKYQSVIEQMDEEQIESFVKLFKPFLKLTLLQMSSRNLPIGLRKKNATRICSRPVLNS